MKTIVLLLPLLLGLVSIRAAAATSQPYAVGSLEQTWHDASRDRDVPVKIYYPTRDGAPAAGEFPVIVFSHGLGGTREGYAYLGEAWAAHGYVSVHVQHLGSDDSAYKHTLRPLRKLARAFLNPENQRNRPLDIRFAIDRLTALQTDPSFPLHGHLQLSEIGVAGHSFGAYTAMAIAGQAYEPGSGDGISMYDPRVKAVIAMSTPVPKEKRAQETFAAVKVPVFHMTGTDDAVTGREGTPAVDRRIPYDRTTHATAYLIIFKGGDHMVFSGRGRRRAKPTDARFHAIIIKASDAYWDAYLKHDPVQLAWLEYGGLESYLGSNGTFEQKHPG